MVSRSRCDCCSVKVTGRRYARRAVEGPPGVGKTHIAVALRSVRRTRPLAIERDTIVA